MAQYPIRESIGSIGPIILAMFGGPGGLRIEDLGVEDFGLKFWARTGEIGSFMAKSQGSGCTIAVSAMRLQLNCQFLLAQSPQFQLKARGAVELGNDEPGRNGLAERKARRALVWRGSQGWGSLDAAHAALLRR